MSAGRVGSPVGRLLLHAAAWAVVVFLVAPTLIIVPMSFSEEKFLQFPPKGFSLKWYAAYFNDPDWLEATRFSAVSGLIAAVGATVIGALAAYALVRGKVYGRRIVELLIVGPIIAPHIALAVALFLVYEQLRLTGTLLGFALAHIVLALPFAIFTILAALHRFDEDLEMAALSCGAGRLRTFFSITLPLILPGVLSAALFAFIISFDEAVVSFFISDVGAKSLPKKIFEDIDYDVSPTVAAVATLLSGLTVAALLIGEGLRRLAEKRAGRGAP